MNANMKRRLAVGTGIIVIVLIAVLAIVGGNTAAQEMSVADAASMAGTDKKVKVQGSVVENSFSIQDNVLSFSIYDPAADPPHTAELRVRHDGGVSATFGNDVTAICTGKVSAEGVLECTELVTQCPSRYENKSDALSVSDLLSYGNSVLDKPVKVAGVVMQGTLASIDHAERFTLIDPETQEQMGVRYSGALSDEVAEGATVVLTGSISADGAFNATVVALEA